MFYIFLDVGFQIKEFEKKEILCNFCKCNFIIHKQMIFLSPNFFIKSGGIYFYPEDLKDGATEYSRAHVFLDQLYK